MKFTERYQTDEDYREKHLSYMRGKIACGCGKEVKRCSLTSHRKSTKHQEWLKTEASHIRTLKKKIALLEPAVEELKRLKAELRQLK